MSVIGRRAESTVRYLLNHVGNADVDASVPVIRLLDRRWNMICREEGEKKWQDLTRKYHDLSGGISTRDSADHKPPNRAEREVVLVWGVWVQSDFLKRHFGRGRGRSGKDDNRR